MAQLSFTLEELIKSRQADIEDAMSAVHDRLEGIKTKILAGEDVERNLTDYNYYSQKAEKLYELYRSRYVDDLKKDYDLFSRMACTLAYELDAVVEKDTIRFNWHGKTLSFVVKMIAAMYNLHAGTFGFDSSFTTHEAYTETNRLVHIGIGRNEDEVLIEFHFFPKTSLQDRLYMV